VYTNGSRGRCPAEMTGGLVEPRGNNFGTNDSISDPHTHSSHTRKSKIALYGFGQAEQSLCLVKKIIRSSGRGGRRPGFQCRAFFFLFLFLALTFLFFCFKFL